jgi:phage antirepressor YoqD-like protein
MELTNQFQDNRFFTNKQISIGFDCTVEAIQMVKTRHQNELIKGIHWELKDITTVGGIQESVVWSTIGVVKLASFMTLTQKAQDFIFEIRLNEELKKRSMPKDFAEALRLAADQYEKIEEQARKIEQDKPKVELANSIIGYKGNFSVKEFIDNLKFIVGKNKFLKILRNDGILMDHPNRNHPYQQYSKYFKIQRVIKNDKSREATLITPEGYTYLAKKYQNLMQKIENKIEVGYIIE